MDRGLEEESIQTALKSCINTVWVDWNICIISILVHLNIYIHMLRLSWS